jgi:hypothetical protein
MTHKSCVFPKKLAVDTKLVRILNAIILFFFKTLQSITKVNYGSYGECNFVGELLSFISADCRVFLRKILNTTTIARAQT